MHFSKLITLFLLIGTVFGIGQAWHFSKDGFLFRRALFPLITQKSDETYEEVLPLLNQSFSFLGKGRQFYVFESADRKYVLKLPRYDHYCLPLWRRAVSFPWFRTREKVHQDLSNRLHFLQESLQIAFSRLKEETALIGIYLSQSSRPLPPITLFDRCGRTYLFPTSKYGFVLQKKAPLLIPTWQAALDKGQIEEARQIFDAFINFVTLRAKKGICNKYPSFLYNYAFDGTQVLQIDTSSFYQDPERSIDSMKQALNSFRFWLQKTHPEWVSYLDDRLKQTEL